MCCRSEALQCVCGFAVCVRLCNVCEALQCAKALPYLPAGQVLLVAWLPEPLIKEHNGAIIPSVSDAPPYCLIQCPVVTHTHTHTHIQMAQSFIFGWLVWNNTCMTLPGMYSRIRQAYVNTTAGRQTQEKSIRLESRQPVTKLTTYKQRTYRQTDRQTDSLTAIEKGQAVMPARQVTRLTGG